MKFCKDYAECREGACCDFCKHFKQSLDGYECELGHEDVEPQDICEEFECYRIEEC